MSPLERLAARIVTGPAGHLAAAVADFSVLFYRLGRARISRRRASG